MLHHGLIRLTLLVLPVLSLCAWGSPAFTGSDDDGPRIGPAALAALRQDAPPPVTAASAVLMDTASGTLLWSRDPSARRAPASLTKIMTALVVRSHDSPAQVVVVSSLAAATPGSRMNVIAGQRLSVDQLLYGLLLPSGNDAAVALAQGTSGSVAAFVAQMNARAAAMGLTGTHFVNPDGLDADGHFSTARDLATMALGLLGDPLLAQIVQTRHEVLRGANGTVLFDLTNLNQLLGSYPGADGVKTGTTPEAGENLIGSATRDGHRLLAVVLGSDDRYADARALLDSGWSHWRWLAPALPPLAALDGGAVDLEAGPWTATPVPAWAVDSVRMVLNVDPAIGPLVSGPRPTPAGSVELVLGQQVVAHAPVLASRP